MSHGRLCEEGIPGRERAGVLAWRQEQANNKEASTPRVWRMQREVWEMDGADGQSVCTWEDDPG